MVRKGTDLRTVDIARAAKAATDCAVGAVRLASGLWSACAACPASTWWPACAGPRPSRSCEVGCWGEEYAKLTVSEASGGLPGGGTGPGGGA
jgi:hypothetical protein